MAEANQPPPAQTLLAAAAGGFGGAILGVVAAFVRLIEIGDVDVRRSSNLFFMQGQVRCLAATLGAVSCTPVVGENTPHHSRGNGEKVSAIMKREFAFREAHKRLVDQRCRLQRVTRTFAAEAIGSNASKVVVDQRRKLFQRLCVAGAPIAQQRGDCG